MAQTLSATGLTIHERVSRLLLSGPQGKMDEDAVVASLFVSRPTLIRVVTETKKPVSRGTDGLG